MGRLAVGLLLALPCACGRIGYDAAGDGGAREDATAATDARSAFDARASVDADTSAAPDATPPCELGSWSAPALVEGLAVSPDSFGPAPSPDGLTLMFSRVVEPGNPTTEDLYVSTRPDRAAPFGAASALVEVNTAERDGTPFLASNDELWFSSDRNGTLGGMDLWRATRTGPGQPFGAAIHLPELSSITTDYLPTLPADGLTVYFASRRGGGASEDLWFAARADRDASFGAPVPVTELNTDDFDTSPFVAADGLEIYFASDRAGAASDLDVYVATRSDPGAPFSAPAPVDEINSADNEEDPAISADRRELFFSSDRDGAFRLWRSTRSCL